MLLGGQWEIVVVEVRISLQVSKPLISTLKSAEQQWSSVYVYSYDKV